jgi:hypothetical protein
LQNKGLLKKSPGAEKGAHVYLFTNALLSYFPAPVKMFFEKLLPAQQKAAHAQVEQQAHGQHGGNKRGPRSYALGLPSFTR